MDSNFKLVINVVILYFSFLPNYLCFFFLLQVVILVLACVQFSMQYEYDLEDAMRNINVINVQTVSKHE